MTHLPHEARAGACRERERAYKAGVELPTVGIYLATGKHPELRVQARTMTARPAARRWRAGSDADHLLGWRERAVKHHLLAASG
jgi:hypothetical protein